MSQDTPSLALLLALLLLTAASCTNGPAQERRPQQAAPVTIGTVVQKTVPVQLRAIGNVEAYATVDIKSRVGGELTRIGFREGQDVKEGDLLFVIDRRPFEAALAEAKAALARDSALAEQAEKDAARYRELFSEGVVSKQQNDKAQADAESARATVRADEAAVENARLQLGYCTLRAPITGRTGSLQAWAGNMIKADADEPMVTIRQFQPIYVNFAVPEQYLPQIKRYMARRRLKVEAYTPEAGAPPVEGTLSFVDSAVDSATGTIRLKATFANRKKRLWPGQFVNVVLTLTRQEGAVVAPAQAVQTGQEGSWVFVVKPDMSVETRTVVVGRSLDGEAVIERGLKAGERVVTDGQLRLVPGAKVEEKAPPRPAEAAAP